ncbi:MAG: bifunctional SulP family inorganic anion transporter/carbonic anhydrase, partial [Gammaproteobacteria bacterium]
SLPMCLGIALASGAPLFAGVIAGSVGGILVSYLGRSHLGISGPAASLIVIVFPAVQQLGYEAFLLSVVVAGVLQLIMSKLGAGMIAYYFPTAVINGMLSGIGLIIFLKQIPHALGYDRDYEGDFAFFQSDDYTTLTELFHMVGYISPGAIAISTVSLVILLLWKLPIVKDTRFSQWLPGGVAAVLVGIGLNQIFIRYLPAYALSGNHLVALSVVAGVEDLAMLFRLPDFSQLDNLSVYVTALTLAVVASIQTLLSAEAIDKLAPGRRVTPNNRDLKAQGFGNICSGLLGGLPLSQLIVRSSVNIQAGAKSRVSGMVNGVLLLGAALVVPGLLNRIPLASLAAVLLVVGYRLINPGQFRAMYRTGIYHFIPFVSTVIGMIFTNLLTGIAIGMAIALFFILLENLKVGFYLHEERKANKTIITLSENVSFLNKANILQLLDRMPAQSEVVIDATGSKYIDYDVYEIIKHFETEAARRDITLTIENLRGYGILEPVRNVLPQTRESQQSITPAMVLQLLKDGNQRFMNNLRSNRNMLEQVNETVEGQFPIAIILSCIDSRTSAELIFDQGLGDVFSVRVAGNIVNDDILGSMEFACKLAGTKLVVVLGHSHCGAVKGVCAGAELDHLTGLLNKIKPALDSVNRGHLAKISASDASLVEKVAERNVELMVRQIEEHSPILRGMAEGGEIGIVGGMYDIETGRVTFYDDV